MTLIRFRLMVTLFLCFGFLTGCIEQRLYFLSPHINTQNSYTATPLIRDSLKIASYGSLHITSGIANSKLVDNVFMGQAKLHQAAYLSRNFQVFYGAQGSAGSYKIDYSNYYFNYPNSLDTSKLKSVSGNKFTGSAGLFGGFALVIPMGNVVEWRVIGAEISVSKEFGAYQEVRTTIPDSLVDLVDRNDWPSTFGGFTDLNFKFKNQKSFGVQFGVGSSMTKLSSKTEQYIRLRPVYVKMGVHFTIERYTGYLQGRFGDYFAGLQTGIAYRF